MTSHFSSRDNPIHARFEGGGPLDDHEMWFERQPPDPYYAPAMAGGRHEYRLTNEMRVEVDTGVVRGVVYRYEGQTS